MSTLVTWTARSAARRPQRLARRAAGGTLAAVVAALGLLTAPLAATALEAAPPLVASAWYFDTAAGTSRTATVGVDVPDQPPPPANPTVPPQTLPAGMQNAEHQYRSAIRFDLSAVPAGAEVSRFTIVLHEQSSAGSVTGVEACAFVEPFTEGDNQDMGDLPEVSCIFSTGGVRGEDDPAGDEDAPAPGGDAPAPGDGDPPSGDEPVQWTFEMPDTAQSWLLDPAEGGIANHGVVLQYLPPPNLQVGEPDPTQSSGRIFFHGPDSEHPPTARIEYTVPSGDAAGGTVALEPEMPVGDGDAAAVGGPADRGDVDGDGFGFASSPQLDDEPSASQEAAPEVAREPAPQAADETTGREQATAPASQDVPITTPWYVWTLVPIGLASLYVLARSLTAEPQIALEREGVMTRLIERRRAEVAASGRPEPLVQV